MSPDARILIIDDNDDMLHAARLALKRHVGKAQTLSASQPVTLSQAPGSSVTITLRF